MQKYNKHVTLRLPERLVDELTAQALREDRSVADITRRLIRKGQSVERI